MEQSNWPLHFAYKPACSASVEMRTSTDDPPPPLMTDLLKPRVERRGIPQGCERLKPRICLEFSTRLGCMPRLGSALNSATHGRHPIPASVEDADGLLFISAWYNMYHTYHVMLVQVTCPFGSTVR